MNRKAFLVKCFGFLCIPVIGVGIQLKRYRDAIILAKLRETNWSLNNSCQGLRRFIRSLDDINATINSFTP